jgi:hypothetical protein
MHLPFPPLAALLAAFAVAALCGPAFAAAEAPQITTATMSPTRFAVDFSTPPEGQSGVARVARGTTFSYRLSKGANVFFFLDRGTKGRSVNGKCRRLTSHNRHAKACVRYVRSGSFRQNGLQGDNTKRFGGRIRQVTLQAAHYRARIIAVDDTGTPSPAKVLRFTILRG